MDPIESIDQAKDTSFAFMRCAHARGHQIAHVAPGDISLNDGSLIFLAKRVFLDDSHITTITCGNLEPIIAEQVDAVFIRTDPPFNQRYIMDTWLLDLLPKQVFVMNDPAGIRSVNEKVWASQFSAWIPKTLVTRNADQYADFLDKHQKVIIKPTDGHGGKGVFVVKAGESNAHVIFETLSDRSSREVIVQAYVADAVNGDKRILLLNGEPLGAILRVHAEGEHRNNFFAGGSAKPTTISAKDLQLITFLKPYLKKMGLYFTGIDVIGGLLIEINVTSPTCIQEMNDFLGVKLEGQVIDFVEQQVLIRKQPRL